MTNEIDPSSVKILIVDDDARNLMAFEAALAEIGATIVAARSGTEALRALLGDEFALIVLDVQMPELDGFATARLIRARPRTEKIPIVFLTAINKHDDHVRRGYALGGVDYLFKPVDPEILRSKVRVFVDLHLRTEEVRHQTERIHILERDRLLEQQRAAHERALRESERAANLELQRKALELESSNTELEQFAYVASHDLREPLRMVASYTELLSRRYAGKLDGEADEYIRFALEGAQRMRVLIADLLALSRVATHGREFELSATAEAVASAVRSLHAAIDEADAQIEITGDLPVVSADATQIVQVFQNLIGNAIKFRGEARPHVRISARHEGQEWVFTVHDNGIGIEERFFERVFRMFQRLHARGDYDGSGIGLAIVKKAVERHHGRVWVESEPGHGAAFHFTLPAVDPAAATAVEAPPR
jgi:signal transduction histidine kinase